MSPSLAPPLEVEENEWAPDRWNRYGFKYQAPGTQTDYLYHPNKVNALGFKYIIGTPTSFKEKNTDKDRSMQDMKAQERLASYDNMKNHFSSSYRQSYIDMNEKRDLVNTNHILSSLTPQKERPSLGSFASEGG